MIYTFEHLDVRGDDWPAKIDTKQAGMIYQTPAWLAFLSRTQNGELVVGALREGRETIGYFAGLIVRKLGLRILGSPFPGWSTDYMGFALSAGADRRRALQALIDFAFQQIGCVHVEITDRHIPEEDFCGLEVHYSPIAVSKSTLPRTRMSPLPT
jgi:hypothetical protein